MKGEVFQHGRQTETVIEEYVNGEYAVQYTIQLVDIAWDKEHVFYRLDFHNEEGHFIREIGVEYDTAIATFNARINMTSREIADRAAELLQQYKTLAFERDRSMLPLSQESQHKYSDRLEAMRHEAFEYGVNLRKFL